MSTATMSARVPTDLKNRYDNLSNATGRATTFYMRRALEEFITDLEDTFAADSAHRAWQAEGGPTITLDEFAAGIES